MAQVAHLHDLSHGRNASNIVPLRQGLLPRHREYLLRWLEAGQRMGVFDAEITRPPMMPSMWMARPRRSCSGMGPRKPRSGLYAAAAGNALGPDRPDP